LNSVISGEWKKEDELKTLRAEVATLERKITLSLKPIDKSDQSTEQSQGEGLSNEVPVHRLHNKERNIGAKIKI
ncbi:MAG: hypothetical protein SNF68_09065, partial [Rikenellaceae bacterium]